MSKLMDELYAEITRLNELQTEVDRTVHQIANIVKQKMAERMEAMQKKLEDSNNEYEAYFEKEE